MVWLSGLGLVWFGVIKGLGLVCCLGGLVIWVLGFG